MVNFPDDSNHQHLRISREILVTQRRPGRPPPRPELPEDPRSYAATLRERLNTAQSNLESETKGYDNRHLLKIELNQRISPEDVAKAASDVEVLSQEDETIVLAFATSQQLSDFQSKLDRVTSGEDVTYQRFLYALQDFSRWTPADRMGWALSQEGFPDVDKFVIDVELWPLDRQNPTQRQCEAFERLVQTNSGEIIDSVRRTNLTIYRVRCHRSFAEDLLNYRDVRTVDLPPRLSLELKLVMADVQQLQQTPPPPQDAPGIVVLDSGLVTGHPVLAPAIGDSLPFLPDVGPEDDDGHGTSVAGVALYDDIADCIENGRFIPELRLFSGRILDEQERTNPPLIENLVEKAVAYFVSTYGCKIFNISYGDLNKPYQGRHVSGLAVTLDTLSRDLDVLFVVPTGNYNGSENGPINWRRDYPQYLKGEDATLIDPAPALNALTIGSIARYERHSRFDDVAYLAIARTGEPSPFTRRGPSVRGAIKPDLVDYGGNKLINALDEQFQMVGQQGTGEVSTAHDFATSRPFGEFNGTTIASARIANAAARILVRLPNASVDLCRALLVTHARTPQATLQLFSDDSDTLQNIVGYGLLDRSALYRSLDNCVTLWAEENIENRQHHFFEIPIPDEFWHGGRRERELTVALAYRPVVRTTRIEYRASNISFKLVSAESLNEVTQWFNSATEQNSLDRITERATKRRFSERSRSRGTVQASTWAFRQPSREVRVCRWFVVVTRNDPAWGTNLSSVRENYALTVNLSDRMAEQSILYAQVRETLRVREQGRIRLTD